MTMDSFMFVGRDVANQTAPFPAPIFENRSLRGLLLGRTSGELEMMGNKSFTLEANILVRQWDTDQQGDNYALVSPMHFGQGAFRWAIRDRRLWAAFSDSVSIHAGPKLELDRCYHVAVIYRVEEQSERQEQYCHLSLYCDGVILGTNTDQTIVMWRENTHYLGGRYGGHPALNGYITNVRLWSEALQAQQLAALQKANYSNREVVNGNGLVLSWQNIARRFLCTRSVLFGGWRVDFHRYTSELTKARVMAMLLVNLRGTTATDTAGRPTIPGSVMRHIFEYLPLD
jgi:hypothetical protein